MNTTETNKLLEDLLAEIGTLGRHNCPEKLVAFCRKLEIQRDEARAQKDKLLDKLDQLYRNVEIDRFKEGAK
jgi:hypothetical protein